MKERRKEGFSLVGFGVAACVACCAGPIIAFLGGVGVAGLLSTAVIGAAGLAVAALAVAGLFAVQRRRSRSCEPSDTAVLVEASTRRADDTNVLASEQAR